MRSAPNAFFDPMNAIDPTEYSMDPSPMTHNPLPPNAPRLTRTAWLPAALVFAIAVAGCSFFPAMRHPVPPYPLLNEKRLALTQEYARIHYGIDGFRMAEPRMIIIHYTAFHSFRESLDFMRPDELSSIRGDIRSGGRVNVGAHYLIDRNGEIYELLPDDIIARHAIGFNHVAIGVENVGRGESELTDAQAEANVKLIHRLKSKYPSIEFLIGHHEYARKDLPHFVLFRELDPGYGFTEKIDPGDAFMSKIRAAITKRYGLNLKN